MITKKNSSKKKKAPVCATPPGILSYPSLLVPDSGRENSCDKYKADLLVDPKVWKEHPAAKKLRATVLEVGRKFFGDDSLELADFKNPFKRTDKIDGYSDNERTKGKIIIRTFSQFQPTLIDAQKNLLDEDAAAKVKGGDEVILGLSVYPYKQKGGGVTVGLGVVQLLKSGEALGGGRAAIIAELDEVEIEDLEDADINTDDDGDDEDEAPKKKRGRPPGKAKPKKKVKDEDEDDDDEEDSDDDSEEDSDDSGEDESEDSEDDVDESDDEDEEDDEEEEKPKKRGRPAGKKKVVQKAKPAKRGRPSSKGKSEEDEDEDFEFDEEE